MPVSDPTVPPPSKIAICADGAECAAALQQIVSAGLRPTVKSGGHGYEDFWQNNPGGVISTCHARHGGQGQYGYRVGAGTMLGVAYAQLYKKYGVTMPAEAAMRSARATHLGWRLWGSLAAVSA